MRSYGQYCSIAKALDVVGDRWTLLIIRELLIRGACRYTDLKNGLPGIATNLLSDRIRELESAGLIRREDAPPPIATTLFHLTDTGAELQPVLDAIGRWGVRYMAEPADGAYEPTAMSFDGHHVTMRFVYAGDPDNSDRFPTDASLDADLEGDTVSATVQFFAANWTGSIELPLARTALASVSSSW